MASAGPLAQWVSVSAGAAVGACLRWQLGILLNHPRFGPVPAGTLASNWLAALIIGPTAAWLAKRPDLAPEVKLCLVTGLLGGLSTFSSFSLELFQLLSNPGGEAKVWHGILSVVLHVGGSLALCGLGTGVYLWAASEG